MFWYTDRKTTAESYLMFMPILYPLFTAGKWALVALFFGAIVSAITGGAEWALMIVCVISLVGYLYDLLRFLFAPQMEVYYDEKDDKYKYRPKNKVEK